MELDKTLALIVGAITTVLVTLIVCVTIWSIKELEIATNAGYTQEQNVGTGGYRWVKK